MRYLKLSELDENLMIQYRQGVNKAFPPIILNSQIIRDYWASLEQYFQHSQVFAVDDNGIVVGFINAIPFFWDRPLDQLPDDGWDWMIKKGIADFQKGIQANYLGGLQIIVTRDFLGKGYSKILIAKAKELANDLGLKKFVVPIRPTFKYKYPQMKMSEYMLLKKEDKIYDPWIRTHLNSGAEIIKVCGNSMNVKGDLKFWQQLTDSKITDSGYYKVEGALNLVRIDKKKNRGEYREENIWLEH